jgi:hypothetical protein
MNETEINSPAPGGDLESQVAALQRQVFLLLLSLVVVTATVVFYLFCQAHFSSNDLAEVQPQAAAMIKQYRIDQAAIENLKSQLIEYGKTHPNFQPILVKDGLIQPATSPR